MLLNLCWEWCESIPEKKNQNKQFREAAKGVEGVFSRVGVVIRVKMVSGIPALLSSRTTKGRS